MTEVLVVGASSALSYLTWVLSTLRDYHVTTCLVSEASNSISKEQWVLYKASSCHQFRPHCVVANTRDLMAHTAGKHPYGLIFLEPLILPFLRNHPGFFRGLSGPQTLFLVDSSEHPFVGAEMGRLLRPSKVLSIHSTMDCRLLKTNPNTCLLMGESGDVLVGITTEQVRGSCFLPFGEDSLTQNPLLTALQNRYDRFHNVTSQFKVLGLDQLPLLSRSIWNSVSRALSLAALSVAYEEPSFAKWDPTVVSALEWVFQEIWAISNSFRVRATETAHEAANLAWGTALEEEKQAHFHRASTIEELGFLPILVAYNKTFYDFESGRQPVCFLTLEQLLRVAASIRIPANYTASLHSRLQRAASARGSRYEGQPPCLLRLYMVHGIVPHQNMMNFAPFQELPPATPPVEPPVGARSPPLNRQDTKSSTTGSDRARGETRVSRVVEDELRRRQENAFRTAQTPAMDPTPEGSPETFLSPLSLPIDPELGALVRGTEMLTFGEEVPFVAPHEPARIPTVAVSQGPGTFPGAEATYYGKSSSSHNFHSLRDTNGDLHIFSNGVAIATIPVANQVAVPELAPVQRAYRHLPAKFYVSASKDRQTIESTFASVGFGRLMESTTTSRYRGYDTSFSVLHGRRKTAPDQPKR